MLSYKTSLTGLIFTLVVLSVSCRKIGPDNNKSSPCVTNANSPYHISFTGKPFAGDTLVFSVDAPSNVKTTWVFRSYTHEPWVSAYIAGRNPEYVFPSRDVYHVSVIINDDTSNINCQNPQLRIDVGGLYTLSELNNIDGQRYWHVRVDSLWPQSIRIDTIAVYNDTFGIQMIDGMTISVKGHLLTTSGKVVTGDSNEYYIFADTPAQYLEWQVLNYYHKKDSVVFNSHPDQGGTIVEGKYPSHEAYGLTTIYHSFK